MKDIKNKAKEKRIEDRINVSKALIKKFVKTGKNKLVEVL